MASENSTLDPDTDEVLPEDEVLEETDEVEVEEEESAEAPSESKVLEKRLRDTQAKLTELAQRNAELTGKLSVLDKPKDEVAPDPFSSLDEEEVVTNPMLVAKAAQSANTMLVRDVVGVLKEMRSEMLKEIRQNDPERLALKSALDELKADPELSDLDDDVLLKIAKRQRRISPTRTVSRPSGTPGSGTRSSDGKPFDIRKTPLYRQMYGGEA